MTWHKRVPLVVVAAVLAILVLTSSAVADNQSGFKTKRPSMLTAVMRVSRSHRSSRSETSFRAATATVDPRWDLRTHPRPGAGRPVREPRDEQGAVPVQHCGADRRQRTERLRQLAGEPADPQPTLRRGVERLVRHQATASSVSAPTTWQRAERDSTGRSCSRTRVARLFTPARGFVAATSWVTPRRRRTASWSRSTSRPASTGPSSA